MASVIWLVECSTGLQTKDNEKGFHKSQSLHEICLIIINDLKKTPREQMEYLGSEFFCHSIEVRFTSKIGMIYAIFRDFCQYLEKYQVFQETFETKVVGN